MHIVQGWRTEAGGLFAFLKTIPQGSVKMSCSHLVCVYFKK